jgi:hypothetical protein
MIFVDANLDLQLRLTPKARAIGRRKPYAGVEL